MPEPRVRIRRGRRTDFVAVMSLLATSGTPLPPPDRATLRRFRNICSDLGADFYLSVEGEVATGLVYVTYTRQLTTPARASLDQLVVGAAHQRRGIGGALLDFAQKRAVRRGCNLLACTLPPAADLERFLGRHGLASAGAAWSVACTPAESARG